jgi:hypothetical protein
VGCFRGGRNCFLDRSALAPAVKRVLTLSRVGLG